MKHSFSLLEFNTQNGDTNIVLYSDGRYPRIIVDTLELCRACNVAVLDDATLTGFIDEHAEKLAALIDDARTRLDGTAFEGNAIRIAPGELVQA